MTSTQATSAVPRRYAGRTVLVTGAGAGIGAAIAQRLAAEGAELILLDRDRAALNQVAGALGECASCHTADVSDQEQSDAAFHDMAVRHGRIHAAVLNAGIECLRIPLHEVALSNFDRVMAVNVRSVFIWLSRLMGHMRVHSGGAIAITSSTAGLRGTQGMGPYVASKHAVIGLMKTAAVEGASHGIRVNCVNPGPVDTRMMESIDSSTGEFEEVRARSLASIPMQRYGRVEEIAALTAFLCSDEASYCSGATYLADGGAMAGR